MHRRTFMIGTGVAGLAALSRPALAQTTAQVIAPYVAQLTYDYPAGQIHVTPDNFRLYWTLGNGEARVYPIRVGRGDLYEAGEFFIGAKKEWPAWTPTPDMIAREPEKYARYAEGGMAGGPGNPLGARALYLFTPERGDTFLRIHGTDDPATIGRAVSNGCAGLTNDQIIDLYDRVPLDTEVFLHPRIGSAAFSPGST